MDFTLSEPEIRVLGSLVEKEITTPEYYPLTLNALVNACNQKTNREPVVSYDEEEVREALFSLKEKDLVIVCEGSRVFKYDNYMAEKLDLSPGEAAVMCMLMLRGPQTAGELRSRTERLQSFEDIAEVEALLEGLASREEPLVAKLPRRPGHKEHRYTHLLDGAVLMDSPESPMEATGESMRERLDRLEAEFAEMKREFAEFRKQFE